jgi:hypothetical protein
MLASREYFHNTLLLHPRPLEVAMDGRFLLLLADDRGAMHQANIVRLTPVRDYERTHLAAMIFCASFWAV